MSIDMDRVKRQIMQCLAISENHAATEGEVAAAMRVATQLMARHNLDREDLFDAGGQATGRVEYGRHYSCCMGIRRTPWEVSLAAFIIKLVPSVSCYWEMKAVRRKPNGVHIMDGKGDVGARVTFYGPDDDAQFAAEMFCELTLQIASMAMLRYGSCSRSSGADYCIGFVGGLTLAHVKEIKKLEQGDAETRALMLRSDKTALALREGAKQWLAKEQGIKLQKGSSFSAPSRFNAAAYSEGREDGRRSSLPTPGAKPKRLS